MLKKFIFILVILSFYCVLNELKAQKSYYSKNFTTENGLPHNHIHSIAQDQNGFMWIATWDGLSRYDGYEFRNYYHNPSDTTSIVYFQTSKVLVDSQNTVWIQCPLGISKYNRETDNFTQFRFSNIGGINLDQNKKFWVSTKSGLFRWNSEAAHFEQIAIELDTHLKAFENIRPYQINFDNENQLWLFADDNLNFHYSRCIFNDEGNLKSNYIGTLEYSKYFATNFNAMSVMEIYVSKDDDLWQFGNQGVYKFEPESGEFIPVHDYKLINDKVLKNVLGQQDLYKMPDIMNSSYTKPESYFVEALYIDYQNTVWQSVLSTGSIANGLTRNIPTTGKFKNYFSELNTENRLNAFFPVMKDKNGAVWSGLTNKNEIFRIDRDGITTRMVPVDNETWLKARQPRSFLEDSTGIWIGYFYNLLLYYDYQKNLFTKRIFLTSNENINSDVFSPVHLIKEGNVIYCAGYHGIYRYQINTQELTTLKLFESSKGETLHSFLRDGETWWAGLTKSQLVQYDNDFNETGRFTFGKGDFNIEGIIAGDDNDLWISQLGGGLVHFDKTTGNYRIYTTANGLSNNTCYGLLKDKHGNIWVSTNQGISRFNPKTGKFRIFGHEDGLKIDEFNSDNTFLATDGEMFFAGMGGVISFYPDSIDLETVNRYTAPLLITDFKVSGEQRYFEKAIYEMPSVKLQKGDNNFQVTFACLDFINSEKIKYRHRLKGENDKFTETDHRSRTVNYTNVRPGKYNLEIEATNANGEWVSKAALTVEIPPIYYQTVWFRILLVLFLLTVSAYFIYTYNRQIRLKARHQQDELKLETLRGQMNPHFIFNSLNSINYFISQNDRLSANRYIADFSRLIRSILGNLSKEYIPLAKELESINDYLQLEHLRFGDKFNYEIIVDETLSTEDVQVFPGMVQPFIENAIWHGVRGLEGRKGYVKIRFSLGNKGLLSCVVEDDGIGRKMAEMHKSSLPGKTSRGIGIVLERLRIINHMQNSGLKVTIEDLYPGQKETGTKVTVDIPVKGVV